MIYIKDENEVGHWCPQRPDGSAIWLTKEEKRRSGNLNLSSRVIEERLQEGWGEEDALTRPLDRRYVSSYQLLGDTFNTWKALDAKRAREAVKELRERKLKEDKPHLFDGTKQQHSRGAWCEHLMANDIFPKVVN